MKKMFTAIVVIMTIALAFAVVANAENYTANEDGMYEITYTPATTAGTGTQYALVVIESTSYTLDDTLIRHIDQAGETANGNVVFGAFKPMALKEGGAGVYNVYVGGGNLTSATPIGTLVVDDSGEVDPPVDPTVAVTGVTIDRADFAMTVGDTPVVLTATVAPADATNKSVTWSSSAPTVATVDNGTVKAVAAGTATITVTTEDGAKTASVTVTVSAAAPPATEPMLGDVNDDDEVDFSDAIRVLRFDVEEINLDGTKPFNRELLTDEQIAIGDVNKDDEVDFSDAIRILRYDVEEINLDGTPREK